MPVWNADVLFPSDQTAWEGRPADDILIRRSSPEPRAANSAKAEPLAEREMNDALNRGGVERPAPSVDSRRGLRDGYSQAPILAQRSAVRQL